MRLTACSTVIVGALASAAIAAPAASAQPNLEPTTGTGQTQAPIQAAAVVPNPDQQTTDGSRISPRALPSQIRALHRARDANSQMIGDGPAAAAGYRAAVLRHDIESPTIVGPAVVHANPFDWRDAAIGAATGLVISLLILGAAAAVMRRSQGQPSRTKALS